MKCISIPTTMRNPYRLIPHLSVFHEVNNNGDFGDWNSSKKEQYLIALIQRRVTRPQLTGLPQELVKKLNDTHYELTERDAWRIFREKEIRGVNDRVNAILIHLKMWGFIHEERRVKLGSLNSDKKYSISIAGLEILEGKREFGAHMMAALPNWKFPNLPDGFHEPVIRPYIATLALLLEVNRLCEENGLEPMAITAYEFDLYGLTLRQKDRIPEAAKQIVAYRKVSLDPAFANQIDQIHNDEFMRLCKEYEGLNNAQDYTSILFHYFNISDYIVLPDKLNRIDLDMDEQEGIETLVARYLESDEE